jgi:FtsP/CotA-like multicopper oxidase with cupredoxin domain
MPVPGKPITPLSPNRRRFVAGAGAFAGALLLPVSTRPLAASASEPVLLEAKPGRARLLEEAGAEETAVWGYRGGVPGPVLRARRGDELHFRLRNNLPQPTTIHWHGIRIDNSMDGVANLTQPAVAPGESFDYRFTVPDAGTFWYHPHNLSWEQVARGLYGALIVEEDDAPAVDQDILLIADDWRLREDGQIDTDSFGSLHDRSHAGRLGNVLTLNGRPFANIPVKSGERVRLRLINTSNARTLRLRFEETEPRVIALDGQPVAPYPLTDGRIEIASAQRADLLIDMEAGPGAKTAITEVSGDQPLVAGHFVYHESERVERRGESLRLPENGIPAPVLDDDAFRFDLVMRGGAMGRLENAVYKGEEMSLRELAREHGMVWTFNGVAGMPEKPLFSVPRGRSVEVRMVNETRWPHAMHFHGHHFRESAEKETGEPGPWRDTLLVRRNETRTISFVADNPGKWMIHCHMLEHQAGGMGTWFEVEA